MDRLKPRFEVGSKQKTQCFAKINVDINYKDSQIMSRSDIIEQLINEFVPFDYYYYSQKLTNAFGLLDRDGNGSVSVDVLKEKMTYIFFNFFEFLTL